MLGAGTLAASAALFFCAGLATWALTGIYLRMPAKWRALAVPNERSSHLHVTPNGGGLAIVLVLVGVVMTGPWLGINLGEALSLTAALAIIAVVGAVDDRRSLGVTLRLASHCLAAILVVTATGPLPELTAFGLVLALGTTTYWLVSVLLLVVLVNFYNFMDGIDGLAAGQALSVTLGAVLVLSPALAPMALFMLVAVAGSCAGFLYWNWSPARVFMGDVSSGVLGLAFGILILATASETVWVLAPQSVWVWLVLLNAFAVDATVTLLRRAWRRQRVWAGHREHAYQHAAARWGHTRVTSAFMAVNVLWLMPIASWIAADPDLGSWLWCLATAPLVALALWAGAGSANHVPVRHQ